MEESTVCELQSFVLTEPLYTGVQFKGLARDQLLSFAVWLKRERGGDTDAGLVGPMYCMVPPLTKVKPHSEIYPL